jgi:hypothetical protein
MKNEPTEVMIGFDVTRTVEQITIDDDNRGLVERSLDASEFANCSGRSVIEVDAIIDNAVNKMKYCFASLEVDVLTALKERFEKETQVKSFDDPAIEMWVSDSGDVYLRGKLNVTVSNRNGFSDDDVDYIESAADDAMTNNVDKVTDITWYVML